LHEPTPALCGPKERPAENLQPLLSFVLFIMAIPAMAFTPFAPTADIPSNPGNDPALARVIESIQKTAFIEKSEEMLPAYPGAQMVKTEDATGKALPIICLVSADSVANVAAFYKITLNGWKSADLDGETLLWQGTEAEAMKGETVTIRISEAQFFKPLPGENIEIRLWYNPDSICVSCRAVTFTGSLICSWIELLKILWMYPFHAIEF
jgi:hypothetical protein